MQPLDLHRSVLEYLTLVPLTPFTEMCGRGRLCTDSCGRGRGHKSCGRGRTRTDADAKMSASAHLFGHLVLVVG